MGDVKTLLKEARKLIDDKNFKEAQECCKDILRKDKQNYLGLILLGKSLQESEQAPLAFQKAISTKPDHPLAWQGLANYYEKIEDAVSKSKLITIYDEILKLQVEEEKALEIINKLGQLGLNCKDDKVINVILQYLDRKPGNKLFAAAEKQLLDLLKLDLTLDQDNILRVKSYLMNMTIKESDETIHVLLGKLITQQNNFLDAMLEIMNLTFFESSVVFRDWFCKYLSAYFVKQDSFSGFDVEKHMDNIIVGIEHSKFPSLLSSTVLYNKGLYLEAYKQCIPLVNYQEADVTEATFIIKCTFKLKKWSVAQKLTSNFLLKVRCSNFAVTLKKFLFISLVNQQKWQQAVEVSKELPSKVLNIEEQALLAKCYIHTNENVENVMEHLETTEYSLQLKALALIKQEKYNDVIKLLENSAENSLNLFYIGKAFWELKKYNESYVNLLKAAKLDSEHPETFLYLGMFYQQCKEDLLKAKKCFEKCYSLNNTDKHIIHNLSNIYIKLNLVEDNYKLLYNTSQTIQTEHWWINFRLGLHYINIREWENAIIQFRNVIKNDHNNIIAFECLADSYFARGSYTSALKAYNKVIKMNSNNKLHCLVRIGYIHSILTEYDQAISTFKKVLEIEYYSLLALKGIAEAWIKVASKKFEAKLYGSARDTAQNAVNYLLKAVTIDRKKICFWKLLGNVLVFLTKLPNEYSFVYITDDKVDTMRKGKLDIYLHALACYSMSAKHRLQFASYDLASTYFEYYLVSKNVDHCHISFQLTIACIKAKPTSWRNWNLLGKICIFLKKYSLAQHCFIKALSVTKKWSIAEIWCNLGSLYVKINQNNLANHCFWRGQSTSPSYPHSWIGQGLIAEVIREEEAMDLFRHAARLGYHPESALGYADWVCRTIKQDNFKKSSELKYIIDDLNAISYAMDLVTWFSNNETEHPCSYNILGILQERSGLFGAALKSYQKALECAQEDNKNVILLNLARIYLRLEKYDDAITNYKSISEASLDSACGLAYSLFKKNLYEEAYSAYDTALHWLCNNDEDKAELLVAMAGITYMFKGMADSKTLLFHSIQVSQRQPLANSLFAIYSLGLINSDQGLSKLALGELKRYEKTSKYGYDIGFLKSYIVLDKDLNQAIKILSDSIHDYPDNGLLWFLMAQYYLNSTNAKSKIASLCAQKALCSIHSFDNAISEKMIATASIAEHLAGNKIKAMVLAKRGLHLYPCQSDIWAALLFSLSSNKTWSEKTSWILTKVRYMRKNLNITRPLNRWAILLEKKMLTL